MKNIFDARKAVLLVLSVIVNELLGGWTPELQILFKIILLDFASAIIRAGYQNELSSKKAAKGFYKKFMMILLVATASMVDDLVGTAGQFRNTTIYYLIGVDGLSIIENASVFMPVPDWFKDMFKQIQPGERKGGASDEEV